MAIAPRNRIPPRGDLRQFPPTNGPILLLAPDRRSIGIYQVPQNTVVFFSGPAAPPQPPPPEPPPPPAPITFYSSEQTCVNECPDGTVGETISVTKPAGSSTSLVNQDAANAAALAAACAEAAAERVFSPCDSSGVSASIAFVSEAREGELCGFSEYIDPSVPPKKYRTQTVAGDWCNDDYRTGPSGIPDQCSDTTTAVNGGAADYSGTYTHDSATCEVTNLQRYREGGGHPCSAVVLIGNPGNLAASFIPLGFVSEYTISAPWVTNASVDVQRTQVTWTWNGTCFVLSDLDGFGFPLYTGRVVLGAVTKTLSVEDKEADAFARTTPVAGTSNIAMTKLRGTGDFTVQKTTVAFDINCIDLTNGVDYRVTLPLITENYGGGSPVLSDLTYDFTASGPTELISDALEADPGKQVTIGNPSIVVLP